METPMNRSLRIIDNEKGFSFIELMVVIFILALLTAIAAPRLIGRTDDAKITKAKVDIAGFETALKLYKIDNGIYPGTEQGVEALVQRPETPPVPAKWREGGYMEKSKITQDPWGHDYIYLSPGSHGPYDILCYGADGVPGGDGLDADINSWDIQ